MLRFTLRLLALALLLLTTDACKKTDTTPKACVFSGFKEKSLNVTYTYELDAQGRGTKVSLSTGEYYILDYSNGALVMRSFDKTGKAGTAYSATLNTLGYITKDRFNNRFTYDGLGNLTRIDFGLLSKYIVLAYDYDRSNLTSTTEYDGKDLITLKSTYEYDKALTLDNPIDYINGYTYEGMLLPVVYGRLPKNRLFRSTVTEYDIFGKPKNYSSVYTYTYTTDSQGKVTRVVDNFGKRDIDINYTCQ